MENIIGIKQKYSQLIIFVKTNEVFKEDDLVVGKSSFSRYLYAVVNPKIKFDPKTCKLNEDLVISKATCLDIEKYQENQKDIEKYQDAFKKIMYQNKIKDCLIGSIICLDNKNIKYFFKLNKRVAYNSIIQDLLEEIQWKYKIEFFQIDCREYFLENGGFGICGYEVCCHKTKLIPAFASSDLINLYKDKYKIKNTVTGACQHSKCCLMFEYEQYEKYKDILPDIGDVYKNNEKEYIVENYDISNNVMIVKEKNGLKYINLDINSIVK